MISTQCKKCRRAGQKLFLKGERCYSQKCAIVRRPTPPGMHGKRRSVLSEYGKQLLEKQKMRNMYGVLERQFRKYIEEIMGKSGDKRELLLKKLESRLDNVVFRLGFAKSRSQARQIVGHGHILVNNKRMDIPSYNVKASDIINIKPKAAGAKIFTDLKESLKKREVPVWLSLDASNLAGKVVSDVVIEDPREIQNLGMIIEFYSR
jgi:small subunit ribosomal protein S4